LLPRLTLGIAFTTATNQNKH